VTGDGAERAEAAGVLSDDDLATRNARAGAEARQARAHGAGDEASSRLSLPITALDLGGDAVFVTDAKGTIVDVNAAFVRLTGYARHEAIGATPRLLSSGYQDEAFYERLWATITAGEVWEGELIDQRRDGELRTHYLTITPVRDGSGRISNYVAVERDVSGEITRTAGTGRSGLIHTDATGRCIYADYDAAAMFDADPTALLGGGLLGAMERDDAHELVEAVAMAVEHGRDLRLDLRANAGRWIQLAVAPLTLASGTVIGARCALEDITERMHAEHELARRSALVSSVLDALDEPVAVVGADGSVLTTNLAWRRAGEERNDLLAALRPGTAAGAAIASAAGRGDPHAAALHEDLGNVLSGRARGRRRAEGFTVHPLAWEEGGAILRHRPGPPAAEPPTA
jgi:PAS domain S-box-containing protein